MCKKGAETIESKSQYVEQSTNELCIMLLTVDSSQQKETSKLTTNTTDSDGPSTKDETVDTSLEIGIILWFVFLVFILFLFHLQCYLIHNTVKINILM